MKQLAEFTWETRETIVVHRASSIERMFCPYCEEVGEMIAPYVISKISDLTERDVFRMVESGTIFSIEFDRLLVCLGCAAAGGRPGARQRQTSMKSRSKQ